MVKSSQFLMVPQTNPMNQDEGFAQGGFCVNGEHENRRTCMTHPPKSEKLVVLYLPALSNSRRWRERKRMPLRKVGYFLVGWPSPIENIPTPCGAAQGPRSCRAVVNSRTSTRSSRSGGQSPVGSVGVDLSVLESRDWWAILRFERGTWTQDTQDLC